MTKPYSLFCWHHRREIEFDLVGVGVFRESESLREPHHVRVHADGLLAEGVAEQNIGGFSPDAGKGQKIVELIGNFALETLDDFTTAVVNRTSLVPVEIDVMYLLFQFRQRRSGVVLCGSVFFEKRAGHLVHKVVPRLSGQDKSD